jgi:hypothetical protein
MSAWTCRQRAGKADPKIVPPRSRIPSWKGLCADSEEKHEPASDIDTVLVDRLKALDPNRPIREADMSWCGARVRFRRQSGHGGLLMAAFLVAVGGKADTACCNAYVGFCILDGT